MRKKLKKSQKAIKRSMLHLAIAAVSVGGAGMAKAQTRPVAPASSSQAQAASKSWADMTNDGRFQESVDAFVSMDREHAPAQGGILFVGSSTIRFWDTLAEQFTTLPIVRRGFGGSRMADCTRYLTSLVTPYRPKMVVVYAGDNDLNEGATPQDVLKSFSDFVKGVRKELPDTRIAYVSIKPSPSRAKIMDQFKETNALIEKYIRSMPNMDYIDTFSAMLDSNGQPRRDLFKSDELHMNEKGYAMWRTIIGPHIMAVPTDPAVPASKTKPIHAVSTF